MINAKSEFLGHVKERTVKCADLIYDETYGASPKRLFLSVGYTGLEREQFLSELAFEYDDGFGHQYLNGTIWYEDDTWSERGEYDGSEWWEHRSCPAIPDELGMVEF